MSPHTRTRAHARTHAQIERTHAHTHERGYTLETARAVGRSRRCESWGCVAKAEARRLALLLSGTGVLEVGDEAVAVEQLLKDEGVGEPGPGAQHCLHV